ncbi:hypothetical protein Tco_0657277 [Tanacetum coccineum]|uniref:Uncharacterized protein n=1 Tax=Tanacetum coccineum TaxID=301880 RepID=A0ABQ4XBX5_9ASTR
MLTPRLFLFWMLPQPRETVLVLLLPLRVLFLLMLMILGKDNFCVANVDLSPVVGGVGVGGDLQGYEHVEMIAQSALGHDRDHDDLYSDDQAFFPTMGDEIKKKLFPLAIGPYYMPYPYSKVGQGRGTECTIYFSCPSTTRLQIKVKNKMAERNKKLKKSNKSLSDMVKNLNDQLVERKLDFHESKTQKYKDMVVDAEESVKNLQNDVTRFLRVDLDHLVQKLLTSDEFNVSFANILTLAINSSIERGIRMDLTDIQF